MSQQRQPNLYDQVTLDDGGEGIIKFIGSLNGKDDLYYGVDLTVLGKHKFNNNNGIIKNIQYFETSNGKNGRLCKKKSIKYYKLTPNSMQLTYDQTIYIESAHSNGIIKYIGIPPDKNTLYIGVELEKDNGNCNGTYLYNGAQYFQSKSKHGLYLEFSSINQSSTTKQQKGNKQYITGTDKNKVITTVMGVNSGIDAGQSGSIKDRMSLWNKKVDDVDKNKIRKEKEATMKAENEERERIKVEKMRKEQKEKAERMKIEREERERQRQRQEAEEKKATDERERKQRDEKEKAEQERLQKQKAERDRKERESAERANAEQIRKEKEDAQRLKTRKEEERLKQEKEKARREAITRKERERRERETKIKQEKLERERLAKEEKERKQREIMIEKERIRKETAAKMKAEKERKEREHREKQIKMEKEKIKRQKAAFETKERERKEREQREKQIKMEKETRLKASKEKAQRIRREKEMRQKQDAAEKQKVMNTTSSVVDTSSIYDNDEDDDEMKDAAEMRRKQQEEEEAELARQMMARKKRKAEQDNKKKPMNNNNNNTTKKGNTDELQDMMSQMNEWKRSNSTSNSAASQFQRKKVPQSGLKLKKGRKFSNAPKAKGKYNQKDLEAAMDKAFGKNINEVTMVKLDMYEGDIPLVLYLLGNELYKTNKFGTFKLFNPEEMQKQKGTNMAHNIANNIFEFFSSMPTPLLDTVPGEILNKALSKDVMKDVIHAMDEPFASTLCYLWDILAKVAMESDTSRMGQQQLGKVFGPMVTMVTQEDVRGNRVSMNVLAASRMMAMFRRGIEWRMELQGFNFDESDDDSD